MRRRAGLLLLVLFASGCAGESALWNPAIQDLRGDNQQMRSMGDSWGSELPKPTMSAR
jgi:outer membrane lipoprotein-sorting protein